MWSLGELTCSLTCTPRLLAETIDGKASKVRGVAGDSLQIGNFALFFCIFGPFLTHPATCGTGIRGFPGPSAAFAAMADLRAGVSLKEYDIPTRLATIQANAYQAHKINVKNKEKGVFTNLP